MKSFCFILLLAAVAFAVDCNVTITWPNGEKYAFDLCPLRRSPSEYFQTKPLSDKAYYFNFFDLIKSKCPAGTNICEYDSNANTYSSFGFLNTTVFSAPRESAAKPGGGVMISYTGEPLPSGVKRQSFFTLKCDSILKPEEIRVAGFGYSSTNLIDFDILTGSACGKKVDH